MPTPKDELELLVKMYQEQKEFADKVFTRVNELKKELTSLIEEDGFTDERGHQWLDAGGFQLKRERRVTVSFDDQFAEEWAKSKGVWDKVKETKEFVNEDQLLAVVWDDEEMKNDLDKFYTKRETYAFKVVEGRSYDEE
jgi:hypothetical protein